MKLTVLVLGLLTACLLPPALAAPDADHGERADRADRAVRSFIAAQGIQVAHVTVMRGDSVILQRGYAAAGSGVPAPDAAALFPVGSISKQFTAALILALADAGRLQLDAPVGRYLPEWFAGEPDLRVSHLLSQTSGLADFLWLDGYRPLGSDAKSPIASFIALGAAAPRRFAPGARWSYSNTNYKALALIAERVGGQPFDELLREQVLRPLAIEGIVSCHRLPVTAYVPGFAASGKPAALDASAAAYVGDGGLCASAQALGAWARRVLAARSGGWTRLAQSSRLADGREVPYGLGVSTRPFFGRAIRWHGGDVDGHSAHLAYLPDEDLTLVLLVNRGRIWLTELMPALIGLSLDTPMVDAPPAILAGRFEDGLFRYVVTPVGSRLKVEIDLIETLDFVPVGRREYVAEKFPASFRLRLPADGSADRFELDWSDVRSYAQRARE